MATPKTYLGIMVSSTFSDLEEHRREVIEAIEKLGFRANVMETSGARADKDVIDTSIRMVSDSVAFVGVISHRYGQTPECSKRNPDALSISELEFNEAMRLGLPILLFIMGDKHNVLAKDVETEPEKKTKLDAFRERAKQMREGSEIERIYEVFSSREEFTKAAAIAIGKLSQALTPRDKGFDNPDEPVATRDSIETALAPELRAVPRYLGSHVFVGRAAELSTLDDWCAAADQHPMLLFEAIGGSGKSMVTWTWLTGRAMKARDDWVGRFWFSFYESGATMTSFCREALAYMTGQPVKALRKQKMQVLVPRLIAELEVRPWLIVLDGLERILVAYHRIEAPQMRDEDVDTAKDQIANRDPRAAINPADEQLLHLLTAAAPSKLLVTSRLIPKALINHSGMPMPGVRREMLAGLRPADGEAFLHACGVSGNSKAVQDYLQRNCDCHPLVIGALAGLVNNYMPDRGNFDVWLADPQAGGSLGLADMNLTQRRNHILDAAIEALSEPGRKLLQTLSLLQGGADYATLIEFNPHLPTPPIEVNKPRSPKKIFSWRIMDDEEKSKAKAKFNDAKKARAAYLESFKVWEQNPEVRAAPKRFDETLTELERRGLLQYEHGLKRYDLHPVVRGVAIGRMDQDETDRIGGQVVDHFSNRPHDPWEQSETLEDLASGIQLIATLTRIGKFDRALGVLDELFGALSYNLMANDESQRLLRPFFPQGWDGSVTVSNATDVSRILNYASLTLDKINPVVAHRLLTRWLGQSVSEEFVIATAVALINSSIMLRRLGKPSGAALCSELALDLAEASGDAERIFLALLFSYSSESTLGASDRADALWARLDPMGRNWSRRGYRNGTAEYERAADLYYRGALTEALLVEVETLCRKGRNRHNLCNCLSLRGQWHLSRDEPDLAIGPFNETLRLYREAGQEGREDEVWLALARLRAGYPVDAHAVAKRLDNKSGKIPTLAIVELWCDLGELERASAAALCAHKYACGDGEPYVHRYNLDRADALLRKLGKTPPEVPKHDPENDEVFDWEDEVRALIKKTREEREKREQEEAESEEKKPAK